MPQKAKSSTVKSVQQTNLNGVSANSSSSSGNSETCPICKKPADKLCSACRSVSYCSVEHQKQHWKKEHKNNCRMWAIKTSEVMGRYIVAARDIPAGTVIMNEEALAVGPKQDTIPLCLSCYKKVEGSYFCSKCSFPMCNEVCENEALHADNECLVFRKKRAFPKVIDYDKHHPCYECILAIRCLRLKETNPKKWTKLNTMEHHNSLRKELEGLWKRNEVNVVQYLRDVYKLDVDPMTIHTVCGFADINSFEIRQDKSSISICGMFPDVSLMAHECISNTHHSIMDNNRMVVRTVIPLKKGDMITTTYTFTLEGTVERRLHVRQSKLFDCLCPRCADPTELGTFFSAVKCKICTDHPNAYLLPPNPLIYNPTWRCSNCSCQVANTTIDAILESIRAEIEEAEQVQSVIELLENIYQKYSGTVLHPNHYLMIGILHSLSQLYGRVKGWYMNDLSLDSLKRKEEVCRKLLRVIDVIEPGLSRIRGATIYELQQAIYFRVQKEHGEAAISVEDLKNSLLEVLELLKISSQIFSFDSPESLTGRMASGIPESMAVIKTILKKVCEVDVGEE